MPNVSAPSQKVSSARAWTISNGEHEPPGGEYEPTPGQLVVETDGVMVRYRDRHLDGAVVDGDWHEVRLGVVGGCQDQHQQQPSYVAAREPAVVFARRLGAAP